MSIYAFYLAAAILAAVGAALMRNTSPFEECGGDLYQQKRMRRLIGELLLLTAALSLGIALIS